LAVAAKLFAYHILQIKARIPNFKDEQDEKMKLSFSTLGCPDWDLDTIIARAGEYGFDGIEFRGIQDELDVSQLAAFGKNTQTTRRKMEAAGISVACFASSVSMSSINQSNESAALDEIKRYVDLCETFRAPYIRIFGGSIGSMSWQEAIDKAAQLLLKADDILADSTTKILIETHDDWVQSHHLKMLMQQVNLPRVGVLWDVNHPFMFVGEQPETTCRLLKPWIQHTHWKDSRVQPESEHGFLPCLMGDGVVPHKRIYHQLREMGYSGFLSLEWEKRWYPQIPGPEVAFPNYVSYMKKLMQNSDA